MTPDTAGSTTSPAADRCAECNARLTHDQRYCVECGTRRGPLPEHVAGLIGAFREQGPERDAPTGDPSRRLGSRRGGWGGWVAHFPRAAVRAAGAARGGGRGHRNARVRRDRRLARWRHQRRHPGQRTADRGRPRAHDSKRGHRAGRRVKCVGRRLRRRWRRERGRGRGRGRPRRRAGLRVPQHLAHLGERHRHGHGDVIRDRVQRASARQARVPDRALGPPHHQIVRRRHERRLSRRRPAPGGGAGPQLLRGGWGAAWRTRSR